MEAEVTQKQSAPKPGLARKLAEVMLAADHVEKDGQNQSQGYKYPTEGAVLRAVRGELARRGVILVPSITSVAWRKVQGKNAELTICTLGVRFEFQDGDTGETIGFDGIGEGMDSGDKNTQKAQSAALKYALLKFFLLPTGDDPDADNKEPRPQRAQPARTEPHVEPDGEESARLAQELLHELEQAEQAADEPRARAAVVAANRERRANRLTAAQHKQLGARAVLAKSAIEKARAAQPA